MANAERPTPREGVDAECARQGRRGVISGCIAILERRRVDEDLILGLIGPSARYVLDGHEGGKEGYWPRVWAARALLYVWDSRATKAVIRATTDDSWRVREMASKVVAKHRLDDATPAVSALVSDEVPRVRAAAERALKLLAANDG